MQVAFLDILLTKTIISGFYLFFVLFISLNICQALVEIFVEHSTIVYCHIIIIVYINVR